MITPNRCGTCDSPICQDENYGTEKRPRCRECAHDAAAPSDASELDFSHVDFHTMK